MHASHAFRLQERGDEILVGLDGLAVRCRLAQGPRDRRIDIECALWRRAGNTICLIEHADHQVTTPLEHGVVLFDEVVGAVQRGDGGGLADGGRVRNRLRLHLGHMRVISSSQEACLKLWKAPREQVFKNDTFVDALKQAAHGTLNWNDDHTELYQNLVQWRNRVADVEGTYPEAVCSLDLLVSICKRMPSCHWSLRQIDYFLPAILADESLGYSGELLSIVGSSGSYCTSSGGEKEESTRLVVRSYEERISVGGDGIGSECATGNISSTSEENDEPQSTSHPSSSHRSLKRAAALILASAALGTVAIIAMRTPAVAAAFCSN